MGQQPPEPVPQPGGSGCCCLVPKATPGAAVIHPQRSLPWSGREERGGGQGPHCTWRCCSALPSSARHCRLFPEISGAGAPGRSHGSGSCPWQGLCPGLAGLRELCSHGHSYHGERAVAAGTCGALSPCWEHRALRRLCRG